MDLLTAYPQLARLCQMAKRKKIPIYLVGGFLRDFILGKKGTDFDFAIKQGAISFAKRWAKEIKGAFVLLDEQYGSARVVRRENGTIFTYDFTDFRAPSIKEDVRKRDFTVNTLCVDILNLNPGDDLGKKIIDHLGALKDLKAKRIRAVSSQVFKEDPLRLMRGFSLAAAWQLKIDAATMAQIKKDKDLITHVAMERVREEIFKVLQSTHAYEICVKLDRIKLLPKMIPHLTVMAGVKQGGYHHLDVWEHSLEVLRQLELVFEEQKDDAVVKYLDEEIGGAHSRRALLKLAALLHDIGKPETKKQEQDRFTFHGHENVGMGITRHVAKHLKVSIKERYFLENMVKQHLRPGYLSNFERPSEKAIFRYFRDAKIEAASLAFLALADQAATQGKLTTKEKTEHHARICAMILERFFTVVAQKPKAKRLITGHDLIKRLKLQPSPLFAEILTQVEEAQGLGKIKTKAEALALAWKIAKI